METINKLLVKIHRSKCLQLLLSALVLCIVYGAYRYQQSDSFTKLSEQYRRNENEYKQNIGETLLSLSDTVPIDVLITFTKAQHNTALQDKFKTCVVSLFYFASIPINLHIIGDDASREIATRILNQSVDKSKYSIRQLDVDSLGRKAQQFVSEIQEYFTYKPGAYYSDPLFFLSIVVHKILPHLKRVIMLDADLKFNSDIKNLFDEFKKFSSTNIIGLARENQPVYRHNFHMFRRENKDTRVGDPPPEGLTGFNSGVVLLDLQKITHSKLYNSLISLENVKQLTQKYNFKGHLGDQDFFTLISLENEDLFYILPCSWNRQLCVWWRDNGYKDVFDQYFKCEGHINIYHGNCNTDIPELDWEQTQENM